MPDPQQGPRYFDWEAWDRAWLEDQRRRGVETESALTDYVRRAQFAAELAAAARAAVEAGGTPEERASAAAAAFAAVLTTFAATVVNQPVAFRDP